jgi:Tfp pilus assembly protein PilF
LEPEISMPRILARKGKQNVPPPHQSAPAPEVTEQNFARVQLAFGDSLAKQGNFEAARAAYEAALRNDDTLARAYHRLALMHEKTGKGGDSRELFQRAMKLDPKNAEIVCDYGYYCYLRQDLREAQIHFDRALELDPNLKRAHNNLGLVYARTSRPDDALRQFSLAGLNPADARANLGFVYLTQKRFPEAKTELQLAANATPRSAKAEGILARFDRIQAGAEPAQTPVADQVSVAATNAPTAERSIHEHFDVEPLRVAATPRHAAETTRPAVETPAPAAESTRVAAEIQRLAAETPQRGNADREHQVTLASKPVVERPAVRPAAKCELPTQQLTPVLSDYQF